MSRTKIENYVKEWMEGHEPGTFVKDQHGRVMYTAGHSSLNLEAYFTDLLADYIEEKEQGDGRSEMLIDFFKHINTNENLNYQEKGIKTYVDDYMRSINKTQ